MAQNSPRVLHVNGSQEQARYRNAVHDVLVEIQRTHKHTLSDISEAIDVSLCTISNASNKKTDLCATYLNRLAICYGPTVLDPFAALSGGRVVPLEPTEDDPLPPLAAVFYSICKSREGGSTPRHNQILAMVPDLKAAQAAITNLLLQADRILAS